MAFQPCPGVASMVMSFMLRDGDIAENVFHVLRAGPWDPGALHSTALLFNHWWHDGTGAGHAYRNYQGNDTHLLQTVGTDLTTDASPTSTAPAAEASNVGGSSDRALQAGLTFAITARTGLRGRSFRGRTFIAGLSQGVVAAVGDDFIVASEADDLVLIFNHLITDISTGDPDNQLCVLSRYHNNVKRANGIGTPITQHGYSSLALDYQRRRAPLHGRHH